MTGDGVRKSYRHLIIICVFLLVLPRCGGGESSTGSGNIATVQYGMTVADFDLLTEVTRKFYESHQDQYDMLVLWSSPEFAPGHAFYWPVKNDVPGIGYRNVGPEFFDNSTSFGSKRLQGIIWMGPDWITNTGHSSGPRSVLGILAQETGHRWAATVHFMDHDINAESSALLEDAFHWNFYLNTGASPMGGNQWDSLGGSLYRALPADSVEYCQLDLYTMGLITAEDVDPLKLLVNPHSHNTASGVQLSSIKTTEPVTVEAEVKEISIEQIIEIEGRRETDVGFNAKNIRQAWIYVYRDKRLWFFPRLVRLERLRAQWHDFISRATGGRSLMNTLLD